MYLLDTVVLSELRKAPRQRNRNLVRWIGEAPSQDLFVSVLTIGEIERGVERQRQLNPEFAGRITSWLDMVLRTYEGRISCGRCCCCAPLGSPILSNQQ